MAEHRRVILESEKDPERKMIIRNEDVRELIAEVPEGHQHLRITVYLTDGTEVVFQEATIANLVRAYVTVKTHPTKGRVVLRGQKFVQRKTGYAEWQLTEDGKEGDGKL